MYSFVVILQIAVTIACLASVIMIAAERPSSYSNIIITTFACGFVQNGGYILELLSRNVDEGMMAVRAEYLGGAFEICFLTFFIFKYCGHEFKNIVKGLILAESCIVLIGVWTWQFNHLYYTGVSFVSDATIPHLVMDHGPLYYIFALTTVVELIACIFILVVSVIKTNQKHMRYNFIVLIVVVLVPLLGYIFAVLGAVDGYDATPVSVAFAICIFALAIARNHVFDVADAAGEKILSNLENAIIIINSENGYEYSNNRARELFPSLNSYSRGNIIKDVEIQNLFDTSRSNQIKIGGRIFDVSINTVKDEEREIGTTVILFDVTESKNQIEQMKQLMDEAEEANRAKTIFLASVSHEIRTPINVIMGMSEVMLRDFKTEANEQYLNNIQNSSNTLLNLINDMLDFSKIESGNLELNNERFDLKRILSDVVGIYGFRSEQKGIEFIYEISPDIPRYVIGDVLRIRQIMTNLLSNAVKYTQDGFVKLKLGYKRRTDFDIDLIMAIEDTGIGISRENYDKIYQGIVRADQKNHYEIEGTGLGLNITKQLVELMEGAINFKSEVGKGTVFSVAIPVSIDSDSSETVDMDMGGIGSEKILKTVFTAPKAKILVVDDLKINLLVARELLKSTMADITTANSGDECLELVSKEHFDIILLDHRMPRMDGVETLSRMKASGVLSDNTPVIMYTANASADARNYYISKGFSDFITKPTSEEQLIAIIYKFLPESKIIVEE